MFFQIGDKVIHSTYGLGEITRIEEKLVEGRKSECYVFQTPDLQLSIPVDKIAQHNLHPPVPPQEFDKLFDILKSPPAYLGEDHNQRVLQLVLMAREDDLASLCQLVRDLTFYKRSHKLNEQERFILARAEKTLLSEWSYALNVSMSQAYRKLVHLLAQTVPQTASAGKVRKHDTRPIPQLGND
jgi:RNA polymerase-interacting CarD/CdnL/TRCF family regulator